MATDDSSEGVSSGQHQQQRIQSGEALAEWRSLEQVENGSPSTSPPYWDSDDDNDDGGVKPADLYGKHTWKIDKFSQINKRELRSKVFEVGAYKWYILIYPQGCDVCNHLSLFLCVANHDKLLPGWSHFAQFTIAVVNKDPKKSKYSDTLHRFWKKEHDWGWKKFMELSKVMDGFVDADTLIIKAQVQVIRERADRPFRCLDCLYRRELVRVYLTNVESICRRFVEELRGKLGKLIEDKARWSSLCAFWKGIDQISRRRMSREKTESILKVAVKHFFIEKEVTSTLVMDSLYSGLKALEGQNKGKKSKGLYVVTEELPVPIVRIEKDMFALVDDVLLLLERAAIEPLPPKDDKGPQNRTKDGTAGEEFNKDLIERDERRLTELGRRTIEIFVLAHIFSKIEVAYQEAVALKKQEELIREEEAACLAEIEQKARRAADKEKKSKKKQEKQKRNNRKGKDKGREDKTIISNNVQDNIEDDSHSPTIKIKGLDAEPEIVLEKSEAVEDVLSDLSDSVNNAPEIVLPDSEDTDTSEVHTHPPIEASGSAVSVQNGIDRRSASVVDDGSSTCSSDSVPSVVLSVVNKGKSRYHKNQKSPSRGRSHESKSISVSADWANEEASQPVPDARCLNDASQSSNTVTSHSEAAVGSFLLERVVNGIEQHMVKKEEESGSHRNVGGKDVVDVDVSSPPRSTSKIIPLDAPLKLDSKTNAPSDAVRVNNKPSSDSPKQADSSSVHLTKSNLQKNTTLKPTETPSGQEVPVSTNKSSIPPMPVMSRPVSAPLVALDPKPAVSIISTAQTVPVLARSVSAAGRLGPEPTAYAGQSYVPQSYRGAIMGGPGPVTGTSSVYSQNPASAALFSHHSSDRMDPNSIRPNLSIGMANHCDFLQNRPPVWNEHPQQVNDVQSYDLYNPVYIRPPHERLPSEFPAGPSGRQSRALQDEFPHLDIINDLLDDEHQGMGMAARVNSIYQSYSNGPHNLNRHYSFPGDPGMPGGPGPSCRFDQAPSYHDEGFQHSYGGSGGTYDTVRDIIPQVGPQAYMNGTTDGFVAKQWQMGNSDVSFLSARNVDNDGLGYLYHIPEYPNQSVGINGYTVYRPSNGL